MPTHAYRLTTKCLFSYKLITLNIFTSYGIAVFAPGVYSPGYAPYTTAHNIIRSHAKAYRLYDRKYRSMQNGIVGITLSTEWAEPKDPNNPEDVAAADRFLQVEFDLIHI